MESNTKAQQPIDLNNLIVLSLTHLGFLKMEIENVLDKYYPNMQDIGYKKQNSKEIAALAPSVFLERAYPIEIDKKQDAPVIDKEHYLAFLNYCDKHSSDQEEQGLLILNKAGIMINVINSTWYQLNQLEKNSKSVRGIEDVKNSLQKVVVCAKETEIIKMIPEQSRAKIILYALDNLAVLISEQNKTAQKFVDFKRGVNEINKEEGYSTTNRTNNP